MSEKKEIIVKAVGVEKHYGVGESLVKALQGIDLDIYSGEYLSILGPSGSGKSTFFNMVGGLDLPTLGSVSIDGYDIQELSQSQLAWLRCNRIGYIFQSFNLIGVMTALENVTLPMLLKGESEEEANAHGMGILKKVELYDRWDHKPDELSGGQQQRVAIGRALANNPKIILADEPTGNLDLKTGEEVIKILKNLSEDYGTTVITATHDMKMLNISTRVVWILDGKVEKIRERKDLQIHIGGMGH
ncbi:MAG: ABC transporter [Planctomycetota bacterium]|nr:MAG: ABC transporter [Planctomycetota bacterium]